ncbi:MAG: hypothetical protein KZQ74_06570 [gamma proteobacterium symbiont of Bathyaustriella thionipta]|nr:hypothetical protein [gamma proteobacterium symbiont of Bathyaustriella thionipta]
MKIILFLVISGISNGSDTEFRHQMEKQYDTLDECVQTSIIMRKVIHAEDNLQARQTDVYAHCEVSREGISAQEYAEANSKIRRLEKFYTTAKW